MKTMKEMRAVKRQLHSMENLKAKEEMKNDEVSGHISKLKDGIKHFKHYGGHLHLKTQLYRKLNRKLKVARKKARNIRRRLVQTSQVADDLNKNLDNFVMKITMNNAWVKVTSVRDVEYVVWMKKNYEFVGGIGMDENFKSDKLEMMITKVKDVV